MKKSASAARGYSRAFFPAVAAFAVVVAVAGFSTTFFRPLLTGAFSAPPLIWIHAALMFAWVCLFLAQTLFIRTDSFIWHQRTGMVGAAIAALIVPIAIAVGVTVLPRDLAIMGEGAYAAFLPTVIEPLLFGALVAAAIALRGRPDVHKRLMVLATLSALGPAWFRFRHFFPDVGNPLAVFGFWLALAPMVGVALWDAVQRGRPHAVFLTVLPAMVAIYAVEVWGGGHPAFIAAAKWIAGLLS